MWELCLVIFALLLFIIYNGVAIKLFGVPESLSNTFYLYLNKKKGLGYIFTGMMFTCALTLMPAWLEITQNISSWSHYLTALPFIGASAIAFVGAAPAFKGAKMEGLVHTVAAYIAAAFALAWCFVVCYKVSYIVPICVLLCGGVAHLTKTAKSGLTYWLEMIAFASAFITMFVESILNLV